MRKKGASRENRTPVSAMARPRSTTKLYSRSEETSKKRMFFACAANERVYAPHISRVVAMRKQARNECFLLVLRTSEFMLRIYLAQLQ